MIEHTRSGDGDPLAVLLVVEEPTFPGCHVRARRLGALTMTDEQGIDEQILAAPIDDPRFAGLQTLDDLSAHWTLEIATFFRTS